MPSDVNFGVRSLKGLLPLRGSKIHLRFQVARDHAIIFKFNSPFRTITGHKLVVTSYADGSGGPLALRTSPFASELPLTCEALPFAGGASAPYLSGCARQLLNVRYAHYAGGASLTTFGFVTIVPRYLPKASNSLTFVRGADRACCAPRKWLCDLICMPFKWLCRPTDALPVPDRTPPEGHRARTRQRHLATYAEITVSYEIVISSGVTRIFSGFQVSGESIWVSSRAVMRRPISLFLLSTVSGGV